MLRLFGRPPIEGAEHIPRHGPVILAGNHLAVADSFYLCLLARRRITFVAKNEFFTGSGWKGRLMRWFYSATGQAPIDRSGGSCGSTRSRRSVGHPRARRSLEGTRSPDGRLYRGKTGTMRVALATGAPVVPVVVRGTDAVNPVGARWWHFGKVHLIVCEPLDLSRYRHRRIDQQVVREATDELMQALRARSGQEYVDSYAVTVGQSGHDVSAVGT